MGNISIAQTALCRLHIVIRHIPIPLQHAPHSTDQNHWLDNFLRDTRGRQSLKQARLYELWIRPHECRNAAVSMRRVNQHTKPQPPANNYSFTWLLIASTEALTVVLGPDWRIYHLTLNTSPKAPSPSFPTSSHVPSGSTSLVMNG